MKTLKAISNCLRSVPKKPLTIRKPRRSYAAAISSASSSASSSSSVSSRSEGDFGTKGFRVYAIKDGQTIGWWHSLPLTSERGYVHFVNEIPRGTTAKMEVHTKEPDTPIAQDVKKGKPRHYGIKSIFNYGCIPQTYENPEEVDPNVDVKALGDGDPLDAVELSDRSIEMGSVLEVVPVGVMCLIDEGEVDWKVFVLDADHPLVRRAVEKSSLNERAAKEGQEAAEAQENTISPSFASAMAPFLPDFPLLGLREIEEAFPGKMEAIKEWFRTYKTYEGKPENTFGLNGEIKDSAFAWKVIHQCHEEYKALLEGDNPRGLYIPDGTRTTEA